MERSLLQKEAHMQDFSNSEDHEDEFEKGLSSMHDAFQSKVDTLTRYTDAVLQVCSVSLAASNIRHTPITKRIKSWESAKGSIRRQHQELVLWRRLRAAIEAKGRQWDEYCREMGLQTPQNETRPLQTTADMFDALQDFGGLRVSLYFPGDVERVASILQGRVEVVKMTNKRQGSGGRTRRLQELVDNLETSKLRTDDVHQRAQVNDSLEHGYSRTFPGYKATHFVVKLRGEDIPHDRKYAWREIVVEIQVGTLVMHVWSEIEHDMIYKPLQSQGEGISDDEERLLDLINGIVLTGEAALQQLEASTTKRLNRRAANKDTMASSYFELAAWIEQDCQLLGVPISGRDWWLLDRVYAILKAMGNHKHSQVTDLLKEVENLHRQIRWTLPIAMLRALCRRLPIAQLEWPTFDGFTVMALAQNARIWAMRLVHSLNLAIYLGVGEEFIEMSLQHPRPSLVSFLDILHPDCPSYTSAESAEAIAEFCRAVLGPHSQFTLRRIDDALHVAKTLPKSIIVVNTAAMTGFRNIMVPEMISWMLSTNGRLDDDFQDFVDASELYGILDFIDFYLTHDGDNVDFHIHLWDRLMNSSINRRNSLQSHNRFFVTQPPRQRSKIGLWKLAECPVQLEVTKLGSEDMNQPSKELHRHGDDEMVNPLDGILQLAFRIFPEDQHVRVQKAWTMARALRPRRKPNFPRPAGLASPHPLSRTKNPVGQANPERSLWTELPSTETSQTDTSLINVVKIIRHSAPQLCAAPSAPAEPGSPSPNGCEASASTITSQGPADLEDRNDRKRKRGTRLTDPSLK